MIPSIISTTSAHGDHLQAVATLEAGPPVYRSGRGRLQRASNYNSRPQRDGAVPRTGDLHYHLSATSCVCLLLAYLLVPSQGLIVMPLLLLCDHDSVISVQFADVGAFSSGFARL